MAERLVVAQVVASSNLVTYPEVFMAEDIRTPEQWLKHTDYRDKIEILDPSGWDNDWTEPITRFDFMLRLLKSRVKWTITRNADGIVSRVVNP